MHRNLIVIIHLISLCHDIRSTFLFPQKPKSADDVQRTAYLVPKVLEISSYTPEYKNTERISARKCYEYSTHTVKVKTAYFIDDPINSQNISDYVYTETASPVLPTLTPYIFGTIEHTIKNMSEINSTGLTVTNTSVLHSNNGKSQINNNGYQIKTNLNNNWTAINNSASNLDSTKKPINEKSHTIKTNLNNGYNMTNFSVFNLDNTKKEIDNEDFQIKTTFNNGSSIINGLVSNLSKRKEPINGDHEKIEYKDNYNTSRHVFSSSVHGAQETMTQKSALTTSVFQKTKEPGGHTTPTPIAGGEPSDLGEFPHMAAIGFMTWDGDYAFDCGGTLISARHVLTAAHCCHSSAAKLPEPQVVRLGDHNIDSSVDDRARPIQVNIKAIHKHPQYTRRKHYNDIALLELDQDVAFNIYIQPACLWGSNDLASHTKAIATGWGIVDPYTGRRSNVLQKVSLHILSNEECNHLLSKHINRKWERGFLDTQLCAGEPQGIRDTCQGDSGSPLQVPSSKHPGRYFVIGITSFGPRFCAQLPAAYTRVSSYLDWIENIVWPDDYEAWSKMRYNNGTFHK